MVEALTLKAVLAFIRRFWWAIPLALLLAWSLRVDHLRGLYKQRWQDVTAEYTAFKTKIIDRTTEALKKEKVDARKADIAHEKEMAGVRAATDRYIAAHRVRRPARNHSGPAAATADTGVPEEVPAGGFVVIADSDVQACAEAVKYSVDAHNWAVGTQSPEPEQ